MTYNGLLQPNFNALAQAFSEHPRVLPAGRVTRVVGMTIEAVGCQQAIGQRAIILSGASRAIEAEVVGFCGDKCYLMCISHARGIEPGAKIIPSEHVAELGVGYALLGRVIDGAGVPLDDKGPIHADTYYPLMSQPINPLKRHPIDTGLDVGIRAINSLLSIGSGQRIGLFAGSGVGKSVLLSMMTRLTEADVVVVGLIGERGREVQEFIMHNLGLEGLQRSVVVATPADETPLMRLHGAYVATTCAEYFRDQGLKVLLLMDSLTRFAQAQREIGLAIGEPPATKGYPPSVFSVLPQLVERAGNGQTGGGSITALYTVLTEGDDQQDPIADSARAILDGHIVLSRELAEAGHFPAIDIEASISRCMTSVTSPEQQSLAKLFRQLYSRYQQNRDLINVGAYMQGQDPLLDKAIQLKPQMDAFLQQGTHEASPIPEALTQLSAFQAAIMEN